MFSDLTVTNLAIFLVRGGEGNIDSNQLTFNYEIPSHEDSKPRRVLTTGKIPITTVNEYPISLPPAALQGNLQNPPDEYGFLIPRIYWLR